MASHENSNEAESAAKKPPVPRWQLHRRLYDWVLHWADTPYGGPALFIMSFAESSFFPIPPDVLLAPLVLGNRKKWFRYALSCSLASLLGGALGYAIGAFAWQVTGNFFHDHVPGFKRDVVELNDGSEITGLVNVEDVHVRIPLMHADVDTPLSITDREGTVHRVDADQLAEAHIHPFTKAGGLYNTYRFWIVFIAGFTPLPYKVITITAGVFKINFLVFMIASAVSRSARFFLVAGLMGLCGERIKPLIDRYFNLLCLAFVILLVGGFAVIELLGSG